MLKRAAVTLHLSGRNLSGRYYCDPIGDNTGYYLLGLRYRVAEDELVGSNLLGWFAVRRADGAVLDWDVNHYQALPRTASAFRRLSTHLTIHDVLLPRISRIAPSLKSGIFVSANWAMAC